MVAGERIERSPDASETSVLPLNEPAIKLAGSEGIEPSQRTSKARGLPLTELPTIGWT